MLPHYGLLTQKQTTRRSRWFNAGQQDLSQMTTDAHMQAVSLQCWRNLTGTLLQRRRELARLTMMYRIVHQLVDIPAEPLRQAGPEAMTFTFDKSRQRPQATRMWPSEESSPYGMHQLPQSAVSLPEIAGHPLTLDATYCF